MRKHFKFALVMAYFLLIAYPLVCAMTKVKGRAGMFIWRHKLAHRRGPAWR